MTQAFRTFLNSNNYYKPEQIRKVIKMVRKNFRLKYSNGKHKYFNVPCAFDIETSSFRLTGNDEKQAIMYIWMFGIYGVTIIGRTWDEFVTMVSELSDELSLIENNNRLLVYVHNLGFEFQFMRKHFKWKKVFSIEVRKPIYALTDLNIEFRCSYLLSGYSLDKLSSQLNTYTDHKKLTGDLDYNKIRHSQTPLTEQELQYCINDVKVVQAYIQEQIEQNKNNICLIPLTKTGYVRKYCRNSCFYNENESHNKSFKRVKYREIIKGLTLEVDEYLQLKRAFQGGFTHANPFYVDKVVENVESFDFTSSYPTVMISELYPMSKSEKIEIHTKEEFYYNLKLYCCLFDVEFEDLSSKVYYENYISLSHCFKTEDVIISNGRVVSAKSLRTTITEQDYYIIEKFYTWKKIKIANFRRYKKGYLPTDFIKAILELYKNKTSLKGVDGSEYDYLISKEMLNSCYGMIVTDIARPEIEYTDMWVDPVEPDYQKEIDKYNSSGSRFLFYPWGVWVTAYARKNLFTGIVEFNNDYIYSDTDSIKVINADNHREYITAYNKMIEEKLYKALEFHDIPVESVKPKTINGEEKLLGVWDFDGHYKHFKSLGAKRYLVQYSEDERNKEKDRDKFALTVAGLNKQNAINYMIEKSRGNVFKFFSDLMYIPPGHTGKNTHTYIDNEMCGVVTDYLGNTSMYKESSGIHLEQSDYSLKISQQYLNYLLNIETLTKCFPVNRKESGVMK